METRNSEIIVESWYDWFIENRFPEHYVSSTGIIYKLFLSTLILKIVIKLRCEIGSIIF